MPEGLGTIVLLLVVGYLLLLTEFFTPGLILGTLGLAAVSYGCYLAFELGPLWGASAIGLSLVATVGGVIVLSRSKAARRLILSGDEAKGWKAQAEGAEALRGKEGRTLTKLRPSGMAEIEGQRVDVVADSEFLEPGIAIRVCDVEGNRIVVEAFSPKP